MSGVKLVLSVALSPAVGFLAFSFIMGPVALALWLENLEPHQQCITGLTKFDSAFGGLATPLDITDNINPGIHNHHSRRHLLMQESLRVTATATSSSVAGTTAAAVAMGSLGQTQYEGHGYQHHNPFASPGHQRRKRQSQRPADSPAKTNSGQWWKYHSGNSMSGEMIGSSVDAAWRMKMWLLITGITGCILGVFEFFVFVNDLLSSKIPLSFPRLIGTAPRMWELLDVIGVVLLLFAAAMLIVWQMVGSFWTWGPDGIPCAHSHASKLWNCTNAYIICWWLITVLTAIGLSVNPLVLSKVSLAEMLSGWADANSDRDKQFDFRFVPGHGPPVASSKKTQHIPHIEAQ